MDMRLDQLTAEMAWVRRLAHALVRDAAAADDVAQEAWIAAHGRVPTDRPIRPWLSRIVLNLVRMRSRSSTRRDAREAASDAPAPPDDAAVLIERVEVQRRLAGEVLALEEPYRTTVLLRYFEGLSSVDIAHRQGVPEGTVRRRLKTGLDRLRERLGDRDRRGLLALAPLALPRPSVAIGGIAMKKLVLALVILLLLLAGVFGVRRWRGGSTDDPATAAIVPPGGPLVGSAVGSGGGFAAGAPQPWLVQRGAPVRKIAGHVRHRGQPVAGAVVRLGGVLADLRRGSPAHQLVELVTTADGAFDFGPLPAALYQVSAESANLAPASLDIASANPRARTDDLVLELGDCRSRMYGMVVDSSGGPVPKARLTAAGLAGTTAGADGTYALCIPLRSALVRVEADGYGGIEREIQSVGELHHDFELVPESVLAGRVVDEAGRAIPGARVIAHPDIGEEMHFVGRGAAVADADGKFRVDGLAPGRFRLVATADGFATPAGKLVTATPGTSKEITLVVARAARISGRVVDAHDHGPVAGALVSLDPAPAHAMRAYAQEDGSFVLEGVPYGKTRLDVAGYDVTSGDAVVVDRPEVTGVELVVAGRATLSGRVLRHGKPVAFAEVGCLPGTVTTSAEDGTYTQTGLSPGTCRLGASEMTTHYAFAPDKLVTIAPGANTADVELTGGGEASGVVVDEDGKPVPRVYVRMVEPKTFDLGESTTDGEGRFHCLTMAGGDYQISVYPTPAAQTPFEPVGEAPVVNVANGDASVTDLKVAIKYRRLAISGHLVDDAGAVVADAHVEAIVPRRFGDATMPSIRADAGGRFTIDGLAKGLYNLHAHTADGAEAEASDVPAGTTDVEIKIPRTGAIEGRLVGFTATPIVRAHSLTPNVIIGREATIDGDRFTLTGLSPGKYGLEANVGTERDGIAVEVTSGATAKVTLTSRARGRIEGRLVEYGTRTPVASARCVAVLSMGGQSGAFGPNVSPDNGTTDAKGAFVLPASVGRIRVMCFPVDLALAFAGADVDVVAGTPTQIELAAVRSVLPDSEIGFSLTPLTLPLVVAEVDARGAAAAAGLKAGDHLVAIDGTSTAGLLPTGASTLCRNHRPGSTLALTVERGGATVVVKYTVTARSAP